MDKISTGFSTLCPLSSGEFCCLRNEKSAQTFDELKFFLESVGYKKNFELQAVNPKGFRLKAKLAVRGTCCDPCIGLFKEGTHDIIDKQGCYLHHPVINRCIEHVKTLVKELRIAPYDEKAHRGILRYLQCLVNDLDQLQVVLVASEIDESIKQLAKRLSFDLKAVSIWINVQNQVTNTIFSEHFELVCNEKWLSYHLFEKRIVFHPGSFCQANLTAFSVLLKDVENYLTKTSKALDLYAGVGLFGLVFEKYFDHIVFAETNHFSYEAYLENQKAFSFSKGTYFVDDAKKVLKQHLDADVVFVDPPRKGLEKSIKPDLACLQKGAKLFYISCGAKSLMRDLKELFELGFSLEFAKSYQFFPGSAELETLCVFVKNC